MAALSLDAADGEHRGSADVDHVAAHGQRQEGVLGGSELADPIPRPVSAMGTASSRQNEMDAGVAKQLDAAIGQTMITASIPGAIIGVWGPEGRYVRAAGVADKATRAPIQADFFSRIGSVTKTFTVTGVLQLADQGKLGLDDSIGKYIERVPLGDKITLRQLARMRSGLENYANSTAFQQALVADPFRNFTPQELLGYAFAEPTPVAPGDAFEYSNTNTVLLGRVVEKVSQRAITAGLHQGSVTMAASPAMRRSRYTYPKGRRRW